MNRKGSIIGAGVAGPAVAMMLRKHNIDAAVCEARTEADMNKEVFSAQRRTRSIFRGFSDRLRRHPFGVQKRAFSRDVRVCKKPDRVYGYTPEQDLHTGERRSYAGYEP